jgi:rhamnose transport system permease protein
VSSSAVAVRRGVVAGLLARWEALLVALLIATCFLGQGLSAEFLTGDNVSLAASDISEIALMALPLALVIVAAEIDLSVASILGLSSALMGELWNAGWPVEMILPFVIVVGALAGLVNGLLVTRVGLPSLAVTIGTLALYRGLALVILGDAAVADFPESWTSLAFDNVPGTSIPYTMVLFAVLALAFAVLLHATPFGRAVFAIGANEEAAYFSGIRVKRIKTTLFVLSGAVAALAGAVLTLRLSSARADNGTGFELAVVAAVVLGGVSIFGGRGTILGVVLAVFLLGGIRNALTLGEVSQEWVTIVTGCLLIGSVLGPNLVRRARAARPRRTHDRGAWPPRSGSATPGPQEERA